uniref:C-type lectin domain-containing protein n=1 Tax=Caenorhabditis tropicalis TaxID=1561998 RepID=A0A1I7UDL6_9PELO
MLLLLFLTIPFVYSADPKCPKDFHLFKRNATSKNNHTKHWCIGLFEYENLGNHDFARSVCLANNASLTLPENGEEHKAIGKIAADQDMDGVHAIDGQMSPKCKLRYFKYERATVNYQNIRCKQNESYEFDDANTDPSYLYRLISGSSKAGYFSEGGDPLHYHVADCLTLRYSFNAKTNSTSSGAGVEFCEGEGLRNYETNPVDSVVCGRHSL